MRSPNTAMRFNSIQSMQMHIFRGRYENACYAKTRSGSSVRTRDNRGMPWCVVEPREIDWVFRSPSRGSSKYRFVVEGVPEEIHAWDGIV